MTELEVDLQAKIEQLKAENAILKEKNLLLIRMIFGRRSERRLPVDPNQLTIQFEPKAILEEEKEQFNTGHL